jgi:hypothetical protein
MVISDHMYYSEWLVNISFAVLLGGVEFGLCVVWKVQTVLCSKRAKNGLNG